MSKTTTAFKPAKDSLASLVCGFFENNPDESLELDDIADKFAVRRGNVHTMLADCVAAQLLTRSRNNDGDYVYSPGPALPGTSFADASPPAKVVAAKATPGKQVAKTVTKRTAPPDDESIREPLPTLDTIVIEDNVPLPDRYGASNWGPMLAMLKPNQSFRLPQRARSTLAKSITQAHKAGPSKYSMKQVGNHVRVWRIA